MPDEPLRTQVEKCISDATLAHEWLYALVTNEVMPDPDAVLVPDVINGMLSLLGGIVNALDLIAAEFDRRNEILI